MDPFFVEPFQWNNVIQSIDLFLSHNQIWYIFNSTFHFLIFVKTVLNKFNVEQVKEYQQAGRIPALQCKSLTLKEEMKLVLICWQVQNVWFYVLEREMFQQNVWLRYFTMLCNDVEYRRMHQDLSWGQLYDDNKVKISWKCLVCAYSFITPLTFLSNF